jgi:Rod binding domain-containing protein
MNIPPVQSSADIDTSTVPIEDLAGNKNLTRQQKIHEASRQFEAIMLQQILSEMQKPVTTSEFTDDSTASGIYQDYITNALSQSMSKTDSLGFAKIFEQQLSPHTSKSNSHVSAMPSENPAVKKTGSISLSHS